MSSWLVKWEALPKNAVHGVRTIRAQQESEQEEMEIKKHSGKAKQDCWAMIRDSWEDDGRMDSPRLANVDRKQNLLHKVSIQLISK